MKIHTFDQGSDSWHDIRLGKFGSTDANTVSVNGKGLETLCYKKVAELLSGQSDDTYINADMERGNEYEESARSLYEIQTSNLVEQIGYIEFSDYVGGSPDGLVGDDGIIEIKCQRDYNYIKSLVTNKIDKQYLMQMQHLMYVTDRQWCDFIVFNQNFTELVIKRVDRNEQAIEKIKAGLDNGERIIKNILQQVDVVRGAK